MILFRINMIGCGASVAPFSCVMTEDKPKMNDTYTTRNLHEPKYFLLWIALWIVALLMLGRA